MFLYALFVNNINLTNKVFTEYIQDSTEFNWRTDGYGCYQFFEKT